MEELFCGCSEATWTRTWSEAALQTAIKPDHGYSHDSEQIRWLIHMLSSFDYQQVFSFCILNPVVYESSVLHPVSSALFIARRGAAGVLQQIISLLSWRYNSCLISKTRSYV